MSRTVTASDTLNTSIGALSSMTYGTLALIFRRSGSLTGASAAGLCVCNSGGTAQTMLGQDATAAWVTNGGFVATSSGFFPASQEWYLLVARKATGTATPRFSRFRYSDGSWAHANATSSIANGGSPGGSGIVQVHGASVTFAGDLEVRAAWANLLPWAANTTGDALLEASGLPFSLAAWYASAPSLLHVFDQSDTAIAVADRTGGGAQQSSLTGTAVGTNFLPLFSRGAAAVILRPPADEGITEPLGTATETSTAQALGKAKSRALGVATVTETAQPLGRSKSAPLGVAAETDSSQALAASKARALGTASETDTALGLGSTVVLPLVTAVETDTAQAVTAAKSRVLGPAATTDTGRPLVASKARLLGVATDLSTARPLAASKRRDLNAASETSTAQPLGTQLAGALNPAVETDTAQAFGRSKTRPLGVAAYTEIARPFSVSHGHTLGVAVDSSTAMLLGRLKSQVLGVASETDTARELGNAQAPAPPHILAAGLRFQANQATLDVEPNRAALSFVGVT